jgi:hypothetical protein
VYNLSEEGFGPTFLHMTVLAVAVWAGAEPSRSAEVVVTWRVNLAFFN